MSKQQSVDLSANTIGVESSAVSHKTSAEAHQWCHAKLQMEYCGFDISALPVELLAQVLTFVPAQDIGQCSLVCKHWNSICRDKLFWRARCEKEGKYNSLVMGNLPLDFTKVYIKNPLMRNWLKNPKALEGLKYWVNPGKGFRDRLKADTEGIPSDGVNNMTDYIPAQEIDGDIRNWVASCFETFLEQQVDLIDEGCSEELMDNVRPPIYISVWYAARFDSGIDFKVRVELKSGSSEQLDVFDQQVLVTDQPDQAERGIWHKMEYTFIDYKAGVRKITFRMGGVEKVAFRMGGVDPYSQWWLGNYGPKFTLPCVRFAW